MYAICENICDTGYIQFFNLFVFNYNKYIAQNYIKRKRKAERDGIGILRMVEME